MGVWRFCVHRMLLSFYTSCLEVMSNDDGVGAFGDLYPGGHLPLSLFFPVQSGGGCLYAMFLICTCS